MKKFSLLLAVIMLLSCACSAFAQEPTEAPVGANEVMNIRGKQVDQEAAAAEEAFLKSDCAFSVIEADEATGQQLEAEAAMQYRSMAAAAQADGISLTLVAGYQDADTRQAAYEARVQTYRDKRKSEEEAARLAATIQPAANANEHGTGYAADILSADAPQQNTSFAETRAYEWLTAYAAEYGFILRYPQDRQAATGIVFEPWHWRYVGVENALAIRASGLSLEEFIALQRAD